MGLGRVGVRSCARIDLPDLHRECPLFAICDRQRSGDLRANALVKPSESVLPHLGESNQARQLCGLDLIRCNAKRPDAHIASTWADYFSVRERSRRLMHGVRLLRSATEHERRVLPQPSTADPRLPTLARRSGRTGLAGRALVRLRAQHLEYAATACLIALPPRWMIFIIG